MKIACCLFKYFKYGGLQRDFKGIVDECKKRNYIIDVYALEWQGEILAGINVIVLPTYGMTNHARYKKFAEKLNDIFKSQSYDLILGFNKLPGLDIYFAADPCYVAKVKKIQSVWSRLSLRYHALRQLEKNVFCLNSPTHIFVLTEQQQQDFVAYYRTPVHRFHLLKPWIRQDKSPIVISQEDRAKLRADMAVASNHYLLLMVGSGFKTKGLDRALLAVAAMPSAFKNKITFFVIGEDNPKPFMRLIKKLNLNEQVKFLGGQSDVRKYMLASDILLHPAYAEVGGNVILEALVNGLPPLVTDICGYASYVAKSKIGHILPSPFSQQHFNQVLLNTLQTLSPEKTREQGLSYFNHYLQESLPEQAVNLLETIHQTYLQINTNNTLCMVNSGLATFFKKEKLFSQVMALSGEIYRYKENRKTLRFVYQQKGYFAKLHYGIGWKEILKNIVQLRWPVVSAENEWKAIFHLQRLSIPTTPLVGYGMQKNGLAKKRSFLITKELTDMMTLEEVCENLLSHSSGLKVKRYFTHKLAHMVRTLHSNGLNHRDLYFCHILLPKRYEHNSPLYLIDLHRMQIRKKVPKRWLIKDLGSLYFSYLGTRLTLKEKLRFIRVYSGEPLRQSLCKNLKFWLAVQKRGMRLFHEACRKQLPGYSREKL